MKQLLRILFASILMCLTLYTFSQTVTERFTTPGIANWTCPLGVTSVIVNMWGAGGYGGYKYSGGGGNFTRSKPIPVTPGQTYSLRIAACMLTINDQDPNTYFPTPDGTYLRANGPFYQDGGSYDPSGFTPNPYVDVQYKGGYGINETFDGTNSTPSGGGGAASLCGNGYNGNYGGNGGGSPSCSAGFIGGGGGNPYKDGVSPGGGGGGNGGIGGNSTVGGNGEIDISYTCTTSTPGIIGNGHTVVYPQQMVPDSITNITSPLTVNGMTIAWQQSADNVNWVDAKTPTNATGYRFDKDNVQTTTYYRRGNNATCTPGNTFGNWSNPVRINVFTDSANGKITGYVLSKNYSPVKQRKVYVKSLTPLKGKPVGYLDSAITDDQGFFNIDNIFYGSVNDGDSANVRFRVYADTTGRHTYTPVYSNVILTRTSHTYDLGKPAFRDLSTIAIAGQVTQTCVGCLLANNTVGTVVAPLDSVKVLGLGAVVLQKDSSYTGYRNPPGTYGNYTLVFADQDSYKITPAYYNHKIIPKDTTIVLNGDVSNVNFNDTTTHLIAGFYGAGCGDVIGTATLEFDDSLHVGHDSLPQQSVIRKRVTTKADGSYSIRLPARAYTVKVIANTIKVSDPYDKTTTAASIANWFNSIRSDSTKVDSFYRDITTHDTVLNLIYHRAPQIVAVGLNADSARITAACSSQFANYDFWPQGIKRPIYFKVYQGPASRGCLGDTGVVTVRTDISTTFGKFNYDTLKVSHGIAIDSIVAAQPNTVLDQGNPHPYSKVLTAKYTDRINRSFSTDTAKPALPIVVVTGAAVDPTGTDFVTVTPELPMVVLHDPAGNRGFAEWSQETSTSTAMSFSAKSAKNEGEDLEVKVGLNELIGLFVETVVQVELGVSADFSTTRTYANTSETVVTNTSRKTLATSDDPAYVGRDADIVYGQAFNINYKDGLELDYDSAKCQIPAPRPIMVTSLGSAQTSYHYTIGSIRDEEIPRLERAAIANDLSNPDSAHFYRQQETIWQQLIDNNEENVKAASVIENKSFSNGVHDDEETTQTNDRKNKYSYELALDTSVAIKAGFEVAGNGLTVNKYYKFSTELGWDTTITHSTSTTTAYHIYDDNADNPGVFSGDYFSVNVKKDPIYGTPAFETIAGGTQCPHEEGTISLYRPLLTAPVTKLTNIQGNAANFTVYMNSLSSDATPNGKRVYYLFADQASNGDGATILLQGQTGAQPFPIANNGQQKVTVTVNRNTAGGVYNYDNLKLIMSDPCYNGPFPANFYLNPHEYDTILLSADFAAPVSGVTLVTPVNNWVSNKAAHDSVKVTFNGYDTSRLASIAVQYNLPTDPSGNWVTITTIAKAKLGKTSTTYYWKTGKLADGPYNLRLMVKDKLNNIVYSTVATGLIDRTAPALFGVPQPANETYIAGTQIAYSYTENINTNLNSNMASLTDLTAGSATPVQLSAFGNTLIVLPTTSILSNAGHQYRVIVKNVSDINGNVKTAPDTSYFTVGTTTFGTGSDALNVYTTPSSIYEDVKGFLRVQFIRNAKATDSTVVYYNLCGNAVYNKDYTVVYNSKGQSSATGINGTQGQILMPKDSSKVEMYIHPVNDSIGTLNKILNITLSPGGGYTLGSNYRIADTILNHNTTSPVITTNKGTTLCSGDSVTLSTANTINGVAVASYLWSTGAKTQSIKVKTSGSYTVKVTDVNGLIGYSAPAVVTFTCGSPINLIASVLSKSSAVLKWDTVTCAKKYVVQYRKVGTTTWKSDTLTTTKDTVKGLSANTSYQWQVASICQYPVIIISSYTAGTNFKTPASLTAIQVTSTSDYSRAAAGDGFSALLSPNPAQDDVNVQVSGAKGYYSVMLTNLQGVVLWKAQDVTGSSVKIPLSRLAQGIYMVVVTDHVHTGTLKLLKR